MQGNRPPIQSSPGIGPRIGDANTRQYVRPESNVGVRPDVNRLDRNLGSRPVDQRQFDRGVNRPNLGNDPRGNVGIDRRSAGDFNRLGNRAPWDRNNNLNTNTNINNNLNTNINNNLNTNTNTNGNNNWNRNNNWNEQQLEKQQLEPQQQLE